jgi:RNA polymerase sigma-70 factor (ECF subfamily)
VRVQDGGTLTTDGPFVAVKEALGGWLTFEADDFDAAIELASRIPAARMGGAVEVRPVVEYTIAEAGDVEAALELVDRLELDPYHYLHATRAELLRRLDRVDDARAAYERALELVHSEAERRFLEQRLTELR